MQIVDVGAFDDAQEEGLEAVVGEGEALGPQLLLVD